MRSIPGFTPECGVNTGTHLDAAGGTRASDRLGRSGTADLVDRCEVGEAGLPCARGDGHAAADRAARLRRGRIAGGQAARRAGRRPGGQGGRPAGDRRDRGQATGRKPHSGRGRVADHRRRGRAGDEARRRHRGRADRRDRTRQVAAAGCARLRPVRGDREQGPAGQRRRGAAQGRERERRRPVLRGVGGRRHPAAARPARVPGRRHRPAGARHRQRDHQLHP